MVFVIKRYLIKQYAIVFAINLTVLCFGMAVTWMSPMIVKLRNKEDQVLTAPVTDDEVSWIVAASSVTNLFANIVAAYLVDRIGRKVSVVFSCVPKIAACFLYTFATEVWMLYVSRVLDGISESLVMMAVPMYSAEVASKEIRGSLGTIFQFCASVGAVLMLSIGPYVSYKMMSIIYLCISIAAAVPVLFLPDSPYYLYCKGKKEESIKVLKSLRGSDYAASEELKEYELSENSDKSSKMEILKDKVIIKSLILIFFLAVGTQIAGYNGVAYYLQTILESTRTSVSPEFASLIIGLIQLFACVCSSVILDLFGRKLVLITTTFLLGVGMVGLGTYFKFLEKGEPVTGFLNFLPLISLILIIFSYSAGVGSVYWTLNVELLHGSVRGLGTALGQMVACIIIFFQTKYFFDIISSIGPAVLYWIYAGNCIIFMLFIAVFIPETKRKRFSEIQTLLATRHCYLFSK